jgi:hypothetical protein
VIRGMPCDAPGCDSPALWYLSALVPPYPVVSLCQDHARYVLAPGDAA